GPTPAVSACAAGSSTTGPSSRTDARTAPCWPGGNCPCPSWPLAAAHPPDHRRCDDPAVYSPIALEVLSPARTSSPMSRFLPMVSICCVSRSGAVRGSPIGLAVGAVSARRRCGGGLGAAGLGDDPAE